MSDENTNDTDTGAGTDTGGAPEDRSSWTAEQWKADAEKWKTFARKHESTAKQNADAAAKLAQIEQEKLTELEKLQRRADEAEKRAQSLELRELKSKVARDKKLPAYLASRLHGSTKEEIEADADSVLAELKAEQPQPNLKQGSRGSSAPKGDDMNGFIRDLRGSRR